MSLGMRAVSWYVRRVKKRVWASEALSLAQAHKPKANPTPPARVAKRHDIQVREVMGFRCHTVTPRAQPAGACKGVVVYLHGGGFMNAIAPQHWHLIARMADAGLTVEVPLYGLAPKHSFTDAYALLNALYADLHRRHGAARLWLAGDSAGGGLTLGLALSLPAAGLPSPRGLTLISPWLDINSSNPGIDRLERLDPWLGKAGLAVAAQLWSRGADPADPRLSPLHGDLRHLPPTDVYIGTHDILHPDVQSLHHRAKAAGVADRIKLNECPGACHVYPLLPVREGREAATRLVGTIRDAFGEG